MPPRFLRAYPPAVANADSTRWLIFTGADVLLHEATLPDGADPLLADLPLESPLYLGTIDGMAFMAARLANGATLPHGWRALGVRALYGQVDDDVYMLAGYASQILEWQRTSRFCPVCATPTEPISGDWGKRCPSCGYTRYPQVSPAVLALVHNGDEILLAQKDGWGDRYSILAGFVEPGESLEDCVQRETFEEVGVDVDTVQYRGSQPWPFPHQVMVGFTARYAGGDIVIDTHELVAARWFHVDDLPGLPPPLSLSRQLIDAWVREQRGQ